MIRSLQLPKAQWLAGFALAALTLLAYLPVWHAGFIWDDDVYVTANPLLTAPDGLRRIWFTLDSPSQYFPLTYTWLRLERGLWGLHPAGYHGINLLLHTANALLLWRLLKRLALPGAWLAAALFALHPVQVESVAWVSELKNVLMLFFYLLAVRAWVAFSEQPAGRGQWYYLGALGLAALALCAKTTACTLPVTLLLILWLKRQPIGWLRLAQTAPFFGLSLGMGLLTMWWERYHQGTQGTLFAMNWLQRILVASHAFWFYLGKLFWPVNLTFSYPRWTINTADVSSYLWLVAAAAALVGVAYFTRRFQGRGVAAALIFFVVTLSPVMGFVMLYTFRYTYVADHYQYVACIGPLALAAAFLESRRKPAAALSPLPSPLLYLLLPLLGVLTWRQCGMYANVETLWHSTLARNPNCWMAMNNLGIALAARGNPAQAIEYYEQSLQLNPDNAETHCNWGAALAAEGKFDEAIQQYERALQLKPDFVQALNDSGNALVAQGRLAAAIQQYERALQINPDFAEAHNDLGAALASQGKLAQAIQHDERALQLDPDYAEALCNLGNALAARKDWDAAVRHYERAIQINPDYAEAHNDLGAALAGQGKFEEAVPHYQRALQIKPDYVHARFNLGAALDAQGKYAQAIPQYQHVLQLKPDFAQAHYYLGIALAHEAKVSDAPRQFQQALELATAQGNASLAGAARARLKEYQP
jgi:tetratricopeptide (TPR) repeat protein